MHGLVGVVKTGGAGGGNLRERINGLVVVKKPGPGAKLRKKENAWIRRSKTGRGRGGGTNLTKRERMD